MKYNIYRAYVEEQFIYYADRCDHQCIWTYERMMEKTLVETYYNHFTNKYDRVDIFPRHKGVEK